MTNTLFSFSNLMDDRLLFDTSPVALNMHSTGTDDELIPKQATLERLYAEWEVTNPEFTNVIKIV